MHFLANAFPPKPLDISDSIELCIVKITLKTEILEEQQKEIVLIRM